MITFVYPWALFVGLIVWMVWVIALLRRSWPVVVNYPLVSFSSLFDSSECSGALKILRLLRIVIVFLLVVLMGRPLWVDGSTRIRVEGIDIMMTLDVSGSMSLIDDPTDRRTRIDVAKKETLAFIEKRKNDAIGITIFAADALSLCPLTLDKKLLKETVMDIALGKTLSEVETRLGSGLATALNRLKFSKAKSKIVILLTDGMPSESDIFSVDQAVNIAVLMGIKVYTIAIGSEVAYGVDQMTGMLVRLSTEEGKNVDFKLLHSIAKKTGGVAFEARKSSDLQSIYREIDKLEKTEQEGLGFRNTHELFIYLLIVLLIVFSCEYVLRFWWWRGAV